DDVDGVVWVRTFAGVRLLMHDRPIGAASILGRDSPEPQPVLLENRSRLDDRALLDRRHGGGRRCLVRAERVPDVDRPVAANARDSHWFLPEHATSRKDRK